ncbi:MAG: SWIM zinc finger family protein [Planctomycetales bacterium]
MMSWYGRYRGWAPYVPVARRRANATRFAAILAKKEKRTLTPIQVAGRKIANTFWGKSWCENLERYSDYENRLPRGRTYLRNGSVIDLQVEPGIVKSIVSGSDIYRIKIVIAQLSKPAWKRIKEDCSQSVLSLLDLLQGRFDQGIMQRLTQRETGMFPHPKEIKMQCSCPDSAGMCKHIAATMYAVGVRLDDAPELLFTLRNVDHLELISQAAAADNLNQTLGDGTQGGLAGSDLGELFGIDIDLEGSSVATPTASTPARAGKPPAQAKRRAAKTPPKAVSKRIQTAAAVSPPVPTAAQPSAAKPVVSRRSQRLAAEKRAGKSDATGKTVRVDAPEPVAAAARKTKPKAKVKAKPARRRLIK